MSIEYVAPQQSEDWRPGQGVKQTLEEALAAFFVKNKNSDRRDAVRTARHSDPFGFDCPALAEMGYAI